MINLFKLSYDASGNPGWVLMSSVSDAADYMTPFTKMASDQNAYRAEKQSGQDCRKLIEVNNNGNL